MKKISIIIPTYNEQDNVVPLSKEIVNQFETCLPNYDYEIIFIDNHSQDNTRLLLTELCKQNPKVKAIFNAKNFGQFNSPFYGMCQATGDAVILMCADFQDPVTMIPSLVKEWGDGFKIVSCIKSHSKENRMVYFLRTCYYKLIRAMSEVEQIEHFTGFGLYDSSFIEVLRELNDPTPFLRGIVAELGYSRKDIAYTQEKRRAGKTSNNFYKLYDAAMLSFTSYTKIGLRLATFAGFIMSGLSATAAIVYFILKLIYWDNFPMGMAPVLLGVFFLGSLQLFFIGLIGEYIMSINNRVMNRPLVIEEKRINFESSLETKVTVKN